MNWTPVRAFGGMIRVPRPGLVHQATSSPSVSAMIELGFAGAQRQKSTIENLKQVKKTVSMERTVDRVDHSGLTQ